MKLLLALLISLGLMACKGRNETEGGGVDVGNIIKDDVKKDDILKDDDKGVAKDEGTIVPPKDDGKVVDIEGSETNPKSSNKQFDDKKLIDVLKDGTIDTSENPIFNTTPFRLSKTNFAVIPKTNALVMVPMLWRKSIENEVLVVTGQGNSRIALTKTEFKDLASPSVPSLTQYLKTKYPERKYSAFNVNGLSGLRADIEKTDKLTKSDIYLVSELKDFIHIDAKIEKSDFLSDMGETILGSVRIKYKGVALERTPPKTVMIQSMLNLKDKVVDQKGDYSFLNQCYPRVDKDCNSVGVTFGYSTDTSLEISAAGYSHGRIVDLGDSKDVPFDSVYTSGNFLISPKTKTPIEDIYSAFLPKNRQPEFERIDLEVGHVYLIRTIKWPDEDLITKIKVESIKIDDSVVLTYQRLILVPPSELKKQVDEINKHTVEFEQPRDDGEVILFNRDS